MGFSHLDWRAEFGEEEVITLGSLTSQGVLEK